MKTLGDYKVHPLANSLPMMNELEFEELKKQIKLHGLLNPIIIDHKDRIIDGRNRYKACLETETEPRFITLSKFLQDYQMYLDEYYYDVENQTGNLHRAIQAGDEEKTIEHLIILLNVNRRHLTNFNEFLQITERKRPAKNGEIGKKNHENVRWTPGVHLTSDEKRDLEPRPTPKSDDNSEKRGWTPGVHPQEETKPVITIGEIAQQIGVSRTTVKQMKYIAENGSEELHEELKQGKISVKAAYNQLKAAEKAKRQPAPEPKTQQPKQPAQANPFNKVEQYSAAEERLITCLAEYEKIIDTLSFIPETVENNEEILFAGIEKMIQRLTKLKAKYTALAS